MKRTRLAVTLGDPSGIGPEVVAGALLDPDLSGRMDPVVVGARSALLRLSDQGLTVPELPPWRPGRSGPALAEIEGGALPAWGETTAEGGRHAALAVERGVELVRSGECDALVTAPLNKAALRLAGYPYRGHTEMLAALDGAPRVFMMFEAPRLRVLLLTDHVPLRSVPDLMEQGRILEATRLALGFLQRSGICGPRIALAGLNPHAGEEGLLGSEEKTVLAPAVKRLRGEGVSIEGPLPGDTVYRRAMEGSYDLVLAPYHDQGLVAVKTLGLGVSVHYTLGLSFLRASVDHGTAPDIAGRGIADATPMIRAMAGALCQLESSLDGGV